MKVRPKAQLTLPEEIRRALHIGEGDEVEFTVAWFFTPRWLAGEREADQDIASRRGTVHQSAEEMYAHLDSLGSADE